jgi:hypothetical protein
MEDALAEDASSLTQWLWRDHEPFQGWPWAPSLDRRNNALGYQVENGRLVCATVNRSLSYYPDDVFAEMYRAFVVNARRRAGR